MNKEEITCKIPKDQISISPERDNECLIWVSPKAINMANTIDNLQQENEQLKEKYENLLKTYDRMYNINCKVREYCENNLEFTPRLEDVKAILEGVNNE